MNARQHVAFLIGRVMLGGMYLYSGITNVIELGGKVEYAASKGLPALAAFVTLASLLLVEGGISIVGGLRPRLGVAAIMLTRRCSLSALAHSRVKNFGGFSSATTPPLR